MLCKIESCNQQSTARGLCHKHYMRWRRYGDPLKVQITQHHGLTLRQRFLKYVEGKPDFRKKSKCWEWIGYKDPNGYGRLNIDNRPIPAHRLAWELFIGPIPENMNVLHKCDNPSCVRQSHLFLGSQSDNAVDMHLKKRARFGVSLGEAHGCHKLTEKQILDIRSSNKSGVVLAKKYNISTTNISDIRNYKIWKHI